MIGRTADNMGRFARSVHVAMPHLARSQFELVRRFSAAAGTEAMAEPRLLLAVSGGSDSMALLALARLARGDLGRHDVAVYVDHRQRPGSREDGAFVAAAARELGCLAEIRTLDTPARTDEASLRALRYGALAAVAVGHDCRFVLTGHTRDDQIETVIHRLFRGAGRGGLGGIPARRGALLRPLLGFRRVELRDFLAARGLAWREDATNEDPAFARNRIRHQVLPVAARAFGAGAVDHLADLATLWEEEDGYLEHEASRYMTFATTGTGRFVELDVAALAVVPEALKTRVVRHWLCALTAKAPSSFTYRELRDVVALASATDAATRLALRDLDVVAHAGRLSATMRERRASAPAASARRPAKPRPRKRSRN
jgi:tRNA(Ile)-lysidine synthase